MADRGVLTINGSTGLSEFLTPGQVTHTIRADGGLSVLADNGVIAVGAGSDLQITHDGTNTLVTSATGDLIVDNTLVTGSTINRLGTDTAATDFQVQNNSASALFSVTGAGQADFSGNVDATGGLDVDADNVSLSVGAGADLAILHNGTNTVATSATGDLIVDNTNTTGSTILQLGTDTSATDVQIQNDTGTALFTVLGSGQADIPGNLDVTGGIDIDADSAPLTLGAAADLTIQHNGTDSTLVNTTGELKLENNSATSDIVAELGDAAGVTAFSVNDSASAAVFTVDSNGNGTFAGNLDVQGTLTSIDSVVVNIADTHLYLNKDYTTAVAKSGGLVVNYLPTATATTSTTGGFATTTTVNTVGAATFAAGDFIQVSGAADPANDGLYEVLTHAANVLTIDSTPTHSFSQTAFTVDATDTTAAITKVTVSALQAGTDGAWEAGSGSTAAGLVFADLATGAGNSLQQAYDQGATITTASSTDIDFVLTSGDFQVAGAGTFNLDAAGDFSGGVVNSAGEFLFSGGNLQLNDSIPLEIGTGADDSVIHNGTNTIWTHATGDLTFDNTVATGSTIMLLGTDTAATDFQVQNDSASPLFTVLGSGQADIPGNLDVTGGVDIDADNASLTIGAGADLSIAHDGTNTTVTSATGDLILDNTLATGSTINRLGTDTSATDFQVQNDSAAALLTVDGSGQADFAGNLDANLGLDVLGGDFTHASGGTGNVDVSWDFSGGLVNSASELLVSGGNAQFNDDIIVTWGTDDDFKLEMDVGTSGLFLIQGAASTTAATVGASFTTGAISGTTGGLTTGTLALRTGNNTDSVSGTSGAWAAGSGASAVGASGTVTLSSGNTAGALTSGAVTVITGNCAGAGNSGALTLATGTGTSTGDILLSPGTSTIATVSSTGVSLASGAVLSGAAELHFSDSYNASSSWTQTFIPLADSAAEWTAFETAFGEVSLLNAIEQAATGGASAYVSFTETADEAIGTTLTILAADDANANGNIAIGVFTASGAKSRAIGIAVNTASAAGSIEVAQNGVWTIPAAQWDGAAQPAATDIGKPVYASVATAGEYAIAPPSTSGHVIQVMGTYLGSGKVAVSIGEPIEIV